jgi:hypothetical protein
MDDTIRAEAAQAKLDEALREIALLHDRVRELERTNALQAEEIRIMKLRERGRSSEKMSDEDRRQGLLFDEAELHSTAPAEAVPTETVRIVKTTYVRRKPGRTPLSGALSRIEQVIDLSDEEKKAEDGCELVRIGEETSEQVHFLSSTEIGAFPGFLVVSRSRDSTPPTLKRLTYRRTVMISIPRIAAVSFVDRFRARLNTACNRTAYLCLISPAASTLSINSMSSALAIGKTSRPMLEAYNNFLRPSVKYGTLMLGKIAMTKPRDMPGKARCL